MNALTAPCASLSAQLKRLKPEEDVPANQQHMIALNAELAKKWPTISRMESALPDADEWAKRTDKLQYLIKD